MKFSTSVDAPEALTPLSAGKGAKRIREGSPQQEAFWAELREGSGHLLLEARAGTGKSSSCREGMWRLLDGARPSIRYCCYNAAIAREFEADAPPGVEVGTMHRFGFETLQRSFGAKLEKEKTYTILDQIGGAGLKRYVRKSISTLVSLAKNHGLRPGREGLERRLAELLDRFDVETWRQGDKVLGYARDVLGRAAEVTTQVDFDDILWLPVLHDLEFPSVDYLFIDEAQDLNPLQHEMAQAMAGSGRTVVVGDPYQAIYGWRGADADSIANLRDTLGAKTMPLTVTWRCPWKHVELARTLVPDFEAAPDAGEGELVHGPRGLIDDARPGDLVLCRANAPIVSACLQQIARRLPAVVRGRAIGEDLLRVVAKVGRTGEAATVAQFVRLLSQWRSTEVLRLEAKDGTEQQIEQVTDQVACLDAVASSCATPNEMPKVIGDLFSDGDTSSRVTFSSVHRAKGSEARTVVYLQIPYGERRDRLRPPKPWELQQRTNLRYVAVTRSLHSLTLVS